MNCDSSDVYRKGIELYCELVALEHLVCLFVCSGPPEAICGWSGPAVGDEVINKSRAKRAAKFWT